MSSKVNMTSRRRTTSTTHKWTTFEKHTLLCLLAKGIHLEERGKRNDEEGARLSHAYLNVATELNTAVNGVNDFGNDINKKEVAKMIDRMLAEKKGVVGKGGYMERATRGRITRGLKKMWEREPSFDYDGSLSEWKQWRKDSEAVKRGVREGGEPMQGGRANVAESVEGDTEIIDDIWRQAEAGAGPAASNHSVPLNNPAPEVARTPAMANTDTHASFDRLPPNLRNNEKYAWANPTNACNNRSSHGSHSYRPCGRSSAGQSLQYSNRYEPPMLDSYRPQVQKAIESRRPSCPSSSQPLSSIRVEQFDQPQEPASNPSLTHDYSSPSKVLSYSGAAQPTNNPFDSSEEARLRLQIQREMSQRKSSKYKKPGILKRRAGYNVMGEKRRVTIGDKINVERQAMLEKPDTDDQMGEIENLEMSRERGGRERTMANEEELPFNRLDRMRE